MRLYIGRTEVRIHFTFILMLIFLLAASLFTSPTILLGLFKAVSMTGCITLMLMLHELAHIKMAEHVGLIKEEGGVLVLQGIGGFAYIPGLREATPRQELLVAAAGPAANLVALLLASPALFWLKDYSSFGYSSLTSTDPVIFLIGFFIFLNLLSGVLNLLPIFPLDGGKALRAFFGFFYTRKQATELVAWSSRLTALVIAVTLISFGYWYLAPFVLAIIFAAQVELNFSKTLEPSPGWHEN